MTGGDNGGVLWLRRDLRLHDHPALLEAARLGPVTALFVLDDVALREAGPLRLAWLYRTLQALDADLRRHGGALTLRKGRPDDVVPAFAREVGASKVHVSADFTPYGAARDERVRARLAASAGGGVEMVSTGSPYAVTPGRLTTTDGRPYQVFTPFYRAWWPWLAFTVVVRPVIRLVVRGTGRADAERSAARRRGATGRRGGGAGSLVGVSRRITSRVRETARSP